MDKEPVRSRHLTLLQMFYENTDEDHQMTVALIMEYLESHGVSTNIKTLRREEDIF